MDADTVERDLARAVEEVRTLSESRAAQAQRLAQDAIASRTAATAKAAERDQRNAERETARAAVDEALQALGIDEAGLRARLVRDARWRDETRRQIANVDAAVTEAATREGERQRAAALHASQGAPPQDRATLESEMPVVEATLRAADDAWTAARAALIQDDERRVRASALLPALEAQRAISERWEVINKLIGSATGKVFRQFAQSLTLNILLVEANVQLALLSRRYQLQRVPKEEMELQVVDMDMAEQVRPLTSLSGGETFLVSLSLALGLSALASTSTRIESIFIDEGFGTLDADTLDVALSTLEGLKAEGRGPNGRRDLARRRLGGEDRHVGGGREGGAGS